MVRKVPDPRPLDARRDNFGGGFAESTKKLRRIRKYVDLNEEENRLLNQRSKRTGQSDNALLRELLRPIFEEEVKRAEQNC